jgi:hypothetical protein
MKTEAAKNIADITQAAVDLYWLAFLLTGRTDLSIGIASDAVTSQDDAKPFFEHWMRGWQRRLVIGKALTAIHDELADSARQTKSAHVVSSGAPRNSLRPTRRKPTSSELCSRSISFPERRCSYSSLKMYELPTQPPSWMQTRTFSKRRRRSGCAS